MTLPVGDGHELHWERRHAGRQARGDPSRRPRLWHQPRDALLHGVSRIADLPAVLIHGSGDISGPLDTAQALAAAWPNAELVVVDEGHTGGPQMAAAIAAAAARFAG